jgi:polyisoprenyl-teichoic acid--peptidoglycan teichoic acid transferase
VLAADRSPRRRRRRLPSALVVFVAVATLATSGLLLAARQAADKVARLEVVDSVLSGSSPDVENFLLVGSDSRAAVDPSSPDAGTIGTEGDVGGGGRSDTIMVLRRDKASDSASLLSIPRDLWVNVDGDGTKINAAYNSGPATLVETIERELMIPIHHYVEIDFEGFKDLIDAIGGVPICFDYPTRDTSSGLEVPEPGCPVLDGVQALAYARSRHFEQFVDGEWQEDPTADLGRTRRQRDFVNRALQGAIEEIKVDPFSAGELVEAISTSLRVDSDLQLIEAASSLRTAVGAGMETFSLPVVPDTVGDQAVLRLDDEAGDVLAFFAGIGPAPAQ